MNKKFIGIFIVIIFIFTTINVVGLNKNIYNYSKNFCLDPLPDDELDQFQIHVDTFWDEDGRHVSFAQEFKPSLNILTRVQLRISWWRPKYNIIVSIKDNLYNVDLTSVTIEPDELIPDSSGFWYNFDFPDILVIPKNNYFIVFTPDGISEINNKYYWGIKDNNFYEKGKAYYFIYPDEWAIISPPDWTYGNPDFAFKTFGLNNTPPDKPSVLSGPEEGNIGELLNYEAYISDPNGDQISFIFDWGDGTDSGWQYSDGNGTVESSHSWNFDDIYQVEVKARDQYMESEWSDPLTVVIGNLAPLKPSKPSGEISCKINTVYYYSTETTDPNNDQIYYMWDWGDGNSIEWIGPKESGEPINSSHEWSMKGSFNVKVKAKDENGYESPWSDPLSVEMPKFKLINKIPRILLWLFERFPILQSYFNF